METEKQTMKNIDDSAGFTLVEVLIAIAVSGILLIGLVKLYQIAAKGYSLQEQLTEMNQNAKYTIKEISDVLMQAGADCELISDSLEKDNIVVVTSSTSNNFKIKVNPGGGFFVVTKQCTLSTASSCSLQVDNGYAFRFADSLGKIPERNTAPSRSIKTYKLDGVNVGNNKICISGGSSADIFYAGDGLYSFKSQRYYTNGSNLCLNNDSNVLAENLDSLKITFKDSVGNTVTSWNLMRSVVLVVVAKTSLADYRYSNPPYNDHRRRLKLTYNFRLKNKV